MVTEGAFSVQLNNQLNISGLKTRLVEASEHALFQVATRLLTDSRAFVPVLTGALKDSGRIEVMPTFDDAWRIVRAVYPLPYAERQHEEESYWHPSLGFRGAARYLSKPLEMFGEFYMKLFEFEFKRYVEMRGAI